VQERTRTQGFILVHPSSRATSSPLSTVRISTIKDQTISVYRNSTTCYPQEYTTPRRKQSAKTYSRSRTIQNPLYNPENPLLIPSASYNLYRAYCTNKITTPGNSH